MQPIPIDLPDALWLQNHFSDYANPKATIGRLVQQGVLHRLKRGLYLNAEQANEPDFLCRAANRLYGPSYVSFEYALRRHGLIPEHVAHITSATRGKARSKRYHTPVGSFFYQDIPAEAYPHGIMLSGQGRQRFLMAGPEKALCDKLYRVSGIRSVKKMEPLLFEDLRIDRDSFNRLETPLLLAFACKYNTLTLKTFSHWLKRRQDA